MLRPNLWAREYHGHQGSQQWGKEGKEHQRGTQEKKKGRGRKSGGATTQFGSSNLRHSWPGPVVGRDQCGLAPAGYLSGSGCPARVRCRATAFDSACLSPWPANGRELLVAVDRDCLRGRREGKRPIALWDAALSCVCPPVHLFSVQTRPSRAIFATPLRSQDTMPYRFTLTQVLSAQPLSVRLVFFLTCTVE